MGPVEVIALAAFVAVVAFLFGRKTGGGGSAAPAEEVATASVGSSPPPVTSPSPGLRELFRSAGDRYGLDWKLLEAIARVESGLNPNAVSPPNSNGTRDYGLMQINDRTADSLGVAKTSLIDPAVSVETAARLLVSLQREWVNALGRFPRMDELIAAYNAGGPAIRSRGIFNTAYVGKVTDQWARITTGTV